MSCRAEQAGLRVKEVPIVFTDRTRGASKISRKVIWESIRLPWRFRIRPWKPAV
jgi:dolichol-phosphate mannosyltransferase